MGSAFAVWMIVILVVVAIAMFMLKKNHAQHEPVVPMHNDGGSALNQRIVIPVQTDLPATDSEV
jgi:hypothetical protein